MDSINDRVMRIVVSSLGVDKGEVNPQSHFINDLGADSLDSVELIMALEEELDIEIPDEEAEKIQTVQQAIDFVSKNIKPVKS